MTDNIKKIAKEYKNKRIVILVGLEHKPGLLDLLKLDNSTEFTLKEYWTY
jgi:pheromone shutdown protein TraB